MEINFDGSKITLSSEYAGTATPWGDKYVKQHYVVEVAVGDVAEAFGYTKVSECLKAYNGCKDEYNNWMKTSINIYEFADYLQSKYNL